MSDHRKDRVSDVSDPFGLGFDFACPTTSNGVHVRSPLPARDVTICGACGAKRYWRGSPASPAVEAQNMNKLPLTKTLKDGKWFLSGEFTRTDEPNINGVVYPREVMEEAIKEAQKKIERRELFGMVGQAAEVSIDNISHVVTKLELDGNRVMGEVEVLPTPVGEDLRLLLTLMKDVGVVSVGRFMGDMDGNTVKRLKVTSIDLSVLPRTREEP